MSGLKIRHATIADADEMAAIYVDAWRSAYPGMVPDKVLVQMSKRDQALRWASAVSARRSSDAIVIAESAQQGIVGFGSCGRARQTLLAQDGEIYTLYVGPEYQESGVGRELLHRMFNLLVENELVSAVVWVLAANPARFFYETMGGRYVAERTERVWNRDIAQIAYGWADLKTVSSRRRSAREK